MSSLTLETDRLLIRRFDLADLPVIHRILDQTFGDGRQVEDPAALAERRQWLEWTMLSDKWLAELHQPPYGDRAIVLKAKGALIGSVGYVPLLMPFEQMPELDGGLAPEVARYTAEVGLFWAIDPPHQRQGYASEAARAMIAHAFQSLRLKRILANTDFTNTRSQGVMLKLGMRLARNPWPQPHWLQVIGVLDNPDRARMDSLTLKLLITPLLVGGASLAGRRWGPTISGWLVALPYTAGPIVFFLALSQGLAFASATAVGVLAGVASPVVFSLTYGWLAPRLGMPRTLAASCLAFAVATLLLRPLPLWWPLVYPAVIAALALGVRLMPRPTQQVSIAARPPRWEIPARMVVATSYVLLLTAGAPLIGPQLTGLITPFPLFGGTLAIFAHQFQGPEAGISVLRGLLRGLFAFASFFAVLSALLERVGLVAAFGLALAVALLIQAGSLWLIRRRGL